MIMKYLAMLFCLLIAGSAGAFQGDICPSDDCNNTFVDLGVITNNDPPFVMGFDVEVDGADPVACNFKWRGWYKSDSFSPDTLFPSRNPTDPTTSQNCSVVPDPASPTCPLCDMNIQCDLFDNTPASAPGPVLDGSGMYELQIPFSVPDGPAEGTFVIFALDEVTLGSWTGTQCLPLNPDQIFVDDDTRVRATVVMQPPDADGDGVPDAFDNCIDVPNGFLGGACNQQDGDADGYGTACDTDFNNNSATDPADLGVMLTAFLTGSTDVRTDLNCNGAADAADLGVTLIDARGIPARPGPSGLACAGTVPCP